MFLLGLRLSHLLIQEGKGSGWGPLPLGAAVTLIPNTCPQVTALDCFASYCPTHACRFPLFLADASLGVKEKREIETEKA